MTGVYEGYEFVIEVVVVWFNGDNLGYKVCFISLVDLR